MTPARARSFVLSVAALVTAGCGGGGGAAGAAAPDPAAKVKCLGINECRGQSQCDTATHGCAGQNACKGKGWLLVPRSDCSEKGGKVI